MNVKAIERDDDHEWPQPGQPEALLGHMSSLV